MQYKQTTKTNDISILDWTIEESVLALSKRMANDGHLVFELEADATISAEYILLNHFLGEPNDAVENKLAAYLREIQDIRGGWPLFHDGDPNISATVKAYFALKLVGDDIKAPHMEHAKQLILSMGGAQKVNVFTRITLALFGQVPWKAVPYMPAAIMLLPRWFPFHIDKISYWSRTVVVPLFVLTAKKPLARNPRSINIRELFITPPERVRRWNRNPTGQYIGNIFLALDTIGRILHPVTFRLLENRAIARCMHFVKERLNGKHGLGGIFPAMINAVIAMDTLNYPRNHPDYITARQSIDKLLVLEEKKGYCQPCLSPVWDTSLAMHAFLEAGDEISARRAADWLLKRQITQVKGDWIRKKPNLQPGGWAFQYWNDYYPDVDDTAVVGMALDRIANPQYRKAVIRAEEWIIGMQSSNGGWGAFDIDNNTNYLNSIPFADHGALLDPPTVDVSARCLSFLAQLGYTTEHPAMKRGFDFIKTEQEEDGSWFGRWGVNYIYGTWSVLNAFNVVEEDMNAPHIRRAVDWLKSRQRDDGGWGEDCATYWNRRKNEVKASTPSQTSWALLGLMAAGETDSEAVQCGINWLLNAPRDANGWKENLFNAPGFPRIFYLHYHGYPVYFPLWALSRYRNLICGNASRPLYGM